jgi:hydroxymethylpyrimidine pyrophosphatase-like HAD family hydrolase
MLDDLVRICPHLALFDRVVAENGALLYRPDNKGETLLGERPPNRFIETLRQRGVAPLSVGQVIVATWTPNENIVLNTIRDLGLELQVVFNKGAVMVLPSGVNKAKRPACRTRRSSPLTAQCGGYRRCGERSCLHAVV